MRCSNVLKKWVAGMLMAFGVLVLSVFARPAFAADYPLVVDLHEFSWQTDYMSLPGYLRYLVFVENGNWISRHDASVAILNQATTASVTP